MLLKSKKELLAEIYEQTGGVIAETARIYAQKIGKKYNDSFRRNLSAYMARNGISNQSKQEAKAEKKKWEQNESKDTAYLEQIASEKVKSLEDLVRVCKIDLKVWEVERWVANTWGVTAFKSNPKGTYRTNYQIKVWLKRREVTYEQGISKVMEVLKNHTPKALKVTPAGKGHLVATIADLHIGADIKNLMRTPDFDITVLLDYLSQCADKINSYDAEAVTINMLGDFYESLSGLNHENTFKSLAKNGWGADVIIMANEILTDHFLSKINNLVEINMVSGNHDRMTISKKVDNTGEGAKILWYMLKKDYPDLQINYSDSVLVREIDGINYILTHGDKGLNKKEMSKVVFDYGNNKLYNILMEGHWHTRRVVKGMTAKPVYYEEAEVVSLDEANYRRISVSALFTGNYYSESLGFAGTAGMTLTYNNGKGRPEVVDVTL